MLRGLDGVFRRRNDVMRDEIRSHTYSCEGAISAIPLCLGA
jgi:hypothetical protein